MHHILPVRADAQERETCFKLIQGTAQQRNPYITGIEGMFTLTTWEHVYDLQQITL